MKTTDASTLVKTASYGFGRILPSPNLRKLRKLACLGLLHALLILPLTGCHYTVAKFAKLEVRERRDLRGLEVKPDPSPSAAVIVSGGIPHSSWGISEVKLATNKDSILIKMYMRHGGFGRTNFYPEPFALRIDIPEDVNFIKIGKERTTIWCRPSK